MAKRTVSTESIIANALIEKAERKFVYEITMEEIRWFAEACETWFRHHRNRELTVLLDRYEIRSAQAQNAHWFVFKSLNTIKMNSDREFFDFRDYFRQNTPGDMLICFRAAGNVFNNPKNIANDGQIILQHTSRGGIDWHDPQNRYLLIGPHGQGLRVFDISNVTSRVAFQNALVPGTSTYLINDGDLYIVDDIRPIYKLFEEF